VPPLQGQEVADASASLEVCEAQGADLHAMLQADSGRAQKGVAAQMRHYPTDEDDMKEVARLEAPTWMVEQLKLNPSYVHWGPHEDYMWKKEGSGWDAPCIVGSWKEHGFSLDELNEVVNFYFEINKPSVACKTCGGNGHHPDAQWITESWYHHTSPFTQPDDRERDATAIMARFGCGEHKGILGRGKLPPDEVITKYGQAFYDHCISTMENGGEWSTNITQDEADALWDSGRLKIEFKTRPTAEQVNGWNKGTRLGGRGFGHDSINAWICQRRRCERLGVPLTCLTCEGHGHLFTGPAYLTLVLWVLHPRKGCGRGVEVNHIEQDELPAVYSYLRQAAERNAERFSLVPTGIPKLVEGTA